MYVHMYLYINMYVYMHINMYVIVNVYVCVLMRVCLRTQKDIVRCACMYVCMYVCKCVCVRLCEWRCNVCLGAELRECVLYVCCGHLVVIQMKWC